MKREPLAQMVERIMGAIDAQELAHAGELLLQAETLARGSILDKSFEDFQRRVIQFVPASESATRPAEELVGRSIDEYRRKTLPGISLVTCSMNRTENLLKALQSWVAIPEIDEIVIVDWSSITPVIESLADAGVKDPRVKVVRVDGQPRWILSYAFNVGFRVALHDKILKADADIVLREDFFRAHLLESGEFYTGDWKIATPGQEFINGFFYATAESLRSIGGFNEYITTYGWDDDDIYSRLEMIGLERKRIDPDTVFHIPHGDEQRFGRNEEAGNAWRELRHTPHFRGRRNRFIANAMPLWKEGKRHVSFRIVDVAERYIKCVQWGDCPNLVPDHIQKDADYYAAIEVLSWKLGSKVFELARSQLDKLLSIDSLDKVDRNQVDQILKGDAASDSKPAKAPSVNVRKKRLLIDVQHGLGNRMRAWASAAVLAEKMGRELVLIWTPDTHCECRVTDLFRYVNAVEEGWSADYAEKEGCRVYNYMEAEAGAEKNALICDSRNDIYVRSAYVLNVGYSAWNEENAFLRRLSPVEKVADLVASVCSPNDVSAHVRMAGGRNYEHLPYESSKNWTRESHDQIEHWRRQSHYSRFITKIDELLSSPKEIRSIYVAADTPEAYAVFKNRYRQRVRCLARTVYDRSVEQLQYALADAILLGRASLLLGSTWSSFSELAIRLSSDIRKIEMSGKDF